MIRSMTGYGEAESECGDGTVRMEVTSVNGKTLKIETDIPASLQRLRPALDKYVRSKLSRGTVRVKVRMVLPESDGNAWELDEECLEKHWKNLSETAKRLGIEEKIDVGVLAGLPGVIRREEKPSETEQLSWDDVAPVVESGLDALVADRAREGECTSRELEQILSTLRTHTDQLKKMLPSSDTNRYQRYLARVEKLAGDLVAEDVIAREAAVIAERHDISEEVQRLDVHMEEFARVLDAGGPAGNKLEFLSQEMQRETMTICSKADDTEVSRKAVEMRTGAQKIKEQVLNVE